MISKKKISFPFRYIALIFTTIFPLHGYVAAQTQVQGDIVAFVETIRNAMPGMGTNAFVIPTNAQLALFEDVFKDLKQQDYSSVQSKISPYGYTFIRFISLNPTDTFYVLKENIPVQRGWGTYIFDPKASNDVTIEVPHPIWDTNTWLMGIKTFLRLDARWFLMAGTHRYANRDSSSDVAHVTQSVYHIAHKVIATSCSIQIHGFNRSSPEYSTYPAVVISNGTLYPPSVLYTLKSKYEARGFTTGVFSTSTYGDLWRLGATTNTQGKWSNANGKTFVHIEHDYPIRTNDAQMRQAIEAIYETFSPLTGGIESAMVPVAFRIYQNFPNPFNPVTTIEFYLPKEVHMTLTIYDIHGNEIAVLVNRRIRRGRHAVSFHAENLASGVYFYRLQCSSEWIETKKMILMR